ncbi:hypothetical protein GF406_06925 [candidate division KSB1 bacterium]|nr:hypothetical protein [candidate division KSB1 bacterium]
MTQKKIKSYLEKILNSNEFAESETSKLLLEYLVNASLTDEMPKESTIAHEVFGKEISNSKTETNVRVYIRNLRQKLDSYYMNEGKNDSLRFAIPKGRYKVHFRENKKTFASTPVRTWWIVSNILLALALIAFIFIFLSKAPFGNSKPKNELAEHGVWSNLFDNKKPVLLVFGDYYFFRYHHSIPGSRYIRDFQINSDEDFSLMVQDSSDHFIPANLTYLGKFALWTLFDLEKIFHNMQKTVEIKLASDLEWLDLNKYNVIFIGPFKTQRLLTSILQSLNFTYEIHPNLLVYTDQDTSYSYHAVKVKETGYERDYTLVAKLPGPNNNIIYMFSSTHDIGHTSTVRSLTNLEKINNLGEPFQIPENLRYFVGIFQVQGFERTSFDPTLLHFRPIPENFKVINPKID